MASARIASANPSHASAWERGLWSLPQSRTKNARPHIVHLSAQALAVIDALPRIAGDLVYTTTGTTPVTGFGRAKRKG
jgi:hypothetical protein